MANVRLVKPSKQRAAGAKPTEREAASLVGLKAIEREVAGKKILNSSQNQPTKNVLGQTKEEVEKLWKAEMDKFPVESAQLPKITLDGKMMASASHRTGYKWKVMCEITNVGRFATEVKVEWAIIGYTEKYRDMYVMGEGELPVKLRAGDVQELIVETPLPENAYKARADDYEKLSKAERAKTTTHYRGAVFRVKHAQGKAGEYMVGTGLQGLLEVDAKADKSVLASLPKLYTDPKKTPHGTSPNAK